MNEFKGKRILIFQQRGWAINIGHFLAKKLQAEGCRLATLTFKNTTHEFVLKQTEVKYDYIVSNDEVVSDPKKYLGDDDYSLAEICEQLGVDTVWPIIMAVRNFSRSYKDKYYYGFKQNVADEVMVDYMKGVYKYIKIFFDQFRPDIIIAPNIISYPHIAIRHYAAKRGIKMVAVTDSKVRGYYIFSYSEFDDEGPFFDRVDELNAKKAETENLDRAKEYIKKFRQEFIQPDYAANPDKKIPLPLKIRRELSPYKQVLRWYIKGPSKNYQASTGIVLDYKPPRYILRDHYAEKRYKKFMDHFNYYDLKKIKKYVYFPLQFQPEATIDVVAQFFNNQIETARQAAMSLPGDYTLVVKEHPAMVNLRPPSYIEKVARTPNVKLIDYRISSEEVIKGAEMIISPNSTSLVEAAFLKKPAIQLGNLGTTLKMPNVFKHTDLTTLSKKIKEVLKVDLDTPEYERRLENYVAAVYDTGFDFKYETVWEKGRGDDMDNLWRVYKREMKRLLLEKYA